MPTFRPHGSSAPVQLRPNFAFSLTRRQDRVLVGDHVDPNQVESRDHDGDLDADASGPFNAELLARLLEFLELRSTSG